MPLKILETAWVEAAESFEREHTTPFIWERPDRFRIGNVVWETGLDYSMSHRFTIDYLEDYLFIKAVYDELFDVNPEFTLSDILSILEKNPNLMKINRSMRVSIGTEKISINLRQYLRHKLNSYKNIIRLQLLSLTCLACFLIIHFMLT